MLTITANVGRYLPKGLTLQREDCAAISMEVGRGVWGDIARHFRAMGDATSSRHYWQDARSSMTKPEMEGDQAVISIGQPGVRLHWRGGKVYPSGNISRVTGRKIKCLLIPFDDSPLRKRRVALAEAKIPNDEIAVIRSRRGTPILCWIRDRKRKNKDGYMHDLTPLGLLLRSVTIKAKPQVMPTNTEIAATAQAAASKYIRAKYRK